MNIFEAVNARVSTKEAAEFYGITVNRYGKALCPFHNDRRPSLYVSDNHYYCYACHAHGDTVSLAAELFRLSNTDAARKLAADFHLNTDKPLPEPLKQKLRRQTEAQRLREAEKRCFSLLTEYGRMLREWKNTLAPKSPEEEPDKRFWEACRYLDWVEYHLDLLTAGDSFERKGAVDYLMTDGRMEKLRQHLRREEHCERNNAAFTL